MVTFIEPKIKAGLIESLRRLHTRTAAVTAKLTGNPNQTLDDFTNFLLLKGMMDYAGTLFEAEQIVEILRPVANDPLCAGKILEGQLKWLADVLAVIAAAPAARAVNCRVAELHLRNAVTALNTSIEQIQTGQKIEHEQPPNTN